MPTKPQRHARHDGPWEVQNFQLPTIAVFFSLFQCCRANKPFHYAVYPLDFVTAKLTNLRFQSFASVTAHQCPAEPPYTPAQRILPASSGACLRNG
ncbi:hypothetical protein E2C01_051402 [Portunus trituberculatus]|uniref:Uncharacterized protein n=1 Tax=Portunus trituberculatus TaxID=210409 RepID=A0A5B7GEM6_PORTR|nr:hypothetical protein [Portunus trituberculatus]